MIIRGQGPDTIQVQITLRRSWVRRVLAVAGSLVFFAGIGAAMATQPVSDAAGGGNNSNLERRLAAVEKRLTDDGKYTVGAKFCGATAATHTGNLGGYVAAKALCPAACGSSSTAHVCVTEEILHSVSTGVSVPFGWYSSGAFNGQSGSTQRDCQAWSSADSGELGATFNQFGLFTNTCNTLQPVLCCD